MIFKWNYRAVS